MMNISTIIFLITCSVVYVVAYVDPSTTNPQLMKRFEYKLSFKGPHLAFKDGTVPFWKFGGSEFERVLGESKYLDGILKVRLLAKIKCVLHHRFAVNEVWKKRKLNGKIFDFV